MEKQPAKNIIECSDSEFKTISEMIYLGDWMINSGRLPEVIIKKYYNIKRKFLALCKKRMLALQPDKKDDLRDIDCFFYDLTEEHISHYSDDIFYIILSKKLAEFQFPVDNLRDRETLIKGYFFQKIAQEEYLKELETNHLSNVKIAVPDLMEKQEQAVHDLKKKFL